MSKGISRSQLQYVDDLIKGMGSNPEYLESLERMARGRMFHLLFMSAWQPGFLLYASLSLLLATSVLLSISALSPTFLFSGLLSATALALQLFLVYTRQDGLTWIVWRFTLRKVREGYSWNDATDQLFSEALASRHAQIAEETRTNSFPRYLRRLKISTIIHDIVQALKWGPILMMTFIVVASGLAVPPIPVHVLIRMGQWFVFISMVTFLLIIADSMSIQIVRISQPSFIYLEELRQIASEINRSRLVAIWRRLWDQTRALAPHAPDDRAKAL